MIFSRLARKIRQLADVLNGTDALLKSDPLGRQAALMQAYYRDWLLLNHPRYRDSRCLTPFGYGVYSQTDEDGIIHEILSRLGLSTGTFVEFGVEDGMETNTSALLQAGWCGVWLEANPNHVTSIRRTFAPQLSTGRLKVREAFITAENIETLLAECQVPAEPTLLVIDIDGNDYWVWQAIRNYKPYVVVIEYVAEFGPSIEWVMPYDPQYRMSGTRYFGASLKAYEILGRKKGYRLVGCNFYGTNAFFIHDDLPTDRFLAPFTAEMHWEPARHRFRDSGGWGKDPREFSAVQPLRHQGD